MVHIISPWLDFWNTSNWHVDARHKDVYYRQVAKDIARYVPSRTAQVLDYGCGEALYADVVAATAGKVLLCEAAPRVRASIALRFANNPKLQVVAPQEVERLSQHSLDFIVLHSVTQYLTPYEAGTLLALFHRLLDRSGILIVSDVITPADSKAAIRKPLAAPSRNSAAASIILRATSGCFLGYWKPYCKFASGYSIGTCLASFSEHVGLPCPAPIGGVGSGSVKCRHPTVFRPREILASGSRLTIVSAKIGWDVGASRPQRFIPRCCSPAQFRLSPQNHRHNRPRLAQWMGSYKEDLVCFVVHPGESEWCHCMTDGGRVKIIFWIAN